jgi:sensor histidine kinase YesM
VNSQKGKSIFAVCLGYFFWIFIDTVIWTYSSPAKYVLILEINGTRLIYGIIFCALFVLVQWRIINKHSSNRYFPIAFISATAALFAAVLAFFNVANNVLWSTGRLQLQVNNFYLMVLFNCLVLFFSLTGLFYVYYYRNISIQQKEQIAKTKALADEAHLLMLRYQINPHFLFNSLNAIQSMIEKDKDRAKDMIADLSDFFRYTLSKNAQTLVPFKEEMDAIQNYLAIQKARFADRLEIVYDIDTASLNIMLPFFIIHPLVENAIKYGFSAKTEVLHLLIKVTHEKETLVILVKNSGTLVLSDQNNGKDIGSTKTGIENIKKRLALYYPECSSLELLEQKGSVHALITITHPSMAI